MLALRSVLVPRYDRAIGQHQRIALVLVDAGQRNRPGISGELWYAVEIGQRRIRRQVMPMDRWAVGPFSVASTGPTTPAADTVWTLP